MPLRLHKRGKIWHYAGTIDGQRLRGTCGTEDKTRAQRVAAEAETRYWQERDEGPAATLTFGDAAILYRQAGKSTRHLKKVEDYWKDTLVKKINAGVIHKGAMATYPSAMASTRNRQFIVPTQAIINHAAGLDLCPMIRVKRLQVIRREKEPATVEWVMAFAASANPHLGALCLFMFATGARISEALNVLWRDVDFYQAKATIHSTKVGLERRAHLPNVVVNALDKIGGNRNPDEKVFKYSTRNTVQPQWAKACRRAGIKHLKPHACRHGFATAMLQAGIDPVTVAKLGGWKDTAQLFKTYGHAMTDETVTNRIFGTNLTQPVAEELLTTDKIKMIG